MDAASSQPYTLFWLCCTGPKALPVLVFVAVLAWALGTAVGGGCPLELEATAPLLALTRLTRELTPAAPGPSGREGGGH